MTHEEKEELTYWRAQLPKLRAAIDDFQEALADEKDPDEIADLEANIKSGEELYNKIDTPLNVVDIPGKRRSARAQMTEQNG